MKYLSLIVIISILLFGFAPQTFIPNTKSIETITADLVNEVLKDKVGCLSITIVDHDSISYFKTYGKINRINKFLPDTSTIFRIASVSKSFCMVLMLKLIEEGYFKPDDPIENYLPEIRSLKGYADSTKITFRQLASHTAGITREPDLSGLCRGPTSEWEKKTLEAIPYTKFIQRPNSKVVYSNIGYSFLGLAMSRAAKTSYIKLINDYILVPLKMHNTFFDVPENKRAMVAVGIADNGLFNHRNTRIPKIEHKGLGYDVPGGGVYSTPADLAKLLPVLMGTAPQKIITEESLNIMQKGILPYGEAIRRSYTNVEYGLGTVVYHLDNNVTVLAHSGSIPGYWTTYAFDRVKKKAVIIMLNYDKHLDNEGTVVKILNQL